MKRYILPLVLSIFALSSFAQAGKNSTGVSPYVFPDFVTGSVLQKGGGVTEASLDYNTLTQEMLFLQDGKKIVLDQGNVDTIYLNDRKFIPVGSVYYEKLTNTKINLYIQRFNKRVNRSKVSELQQQQSNNAMTTEMGFKSATVDASNYDMHLPDNFDLQPQNVLWIQKGKSFTKVDGLGKILKIFPGSKEDAVNAFIRDRKLDTTKPEDLATIVAFCNLQQ